MRTLARMIPTISWAACLAEALLADVGDRWPHVQGVARRATEISAVVPVADRAYLVAGAYVHDIGYSPALRKVAGCTSSTGRVPAWARARASGETGRQLFGGAEIEVRGAGHLLTCFEPDDAALQDALTHCDITTSPTGMPTTLAERLAEIEARYGASRDPAARQILTALGRSRPHVEVAVQRTERRIHALIAGCQRSPTR